jgi:beta-N-acetylhexosaminidase
MTLREKAAQMILVYHSSPEFMLKHKFGGSLIMSGMLKKPDKLKNSIKTIQQTSSIPLLITIDQEGGKVNRINKLPGWDSVASADVLSSLSDDSIVNYLHPVANSLADLGINTNLAPVLDPSLDWKKDSTFMALSSRSFGYDSQSIVKPATAFSKAFQNKGIQCISKHFPGYDVQTNSDHEIAVSHADSLALHKQVISFQGLAGYTSGIMMSSILFEKISELPAVFDEKMVSWARRTDPQALIMTDDLWGTALRAFVSKKKKVARTEYPASDFKKLTLMAFDAGNDMLMITYPQKAVEMIDILAAESEKDPDRMKRLNASVRRILTTKIKSGLL